MSSKRVAIIGAMDSEVAQLVAKLADHTCEAVYGYTFHSGVLSGVPVVVLKCGIGKVNAARGTQLLIDKYPDLCAIINTGIAGAVSPYASVFDIVVPERVIQHDFDVSAFGHAVGYMCTGVDPSSPTVYRADATLQALLQAVAASLLDADSNTVFGGTLVSGDQFIADPPKRATLRCRFDAVAVDMESGAIAQVAEAANISFAIVRVLSDAADDIAAQLFEDFEQSAANLSAMIVQTALSNFNVV